MTRWARSGNTQKHKKMPGDPTPWREFTKGNANRHNKNQEKRTCDQNTNFKEKPVQSSDWDKMGEVVNIVNDFDSSVFPEQSVKKQKTHDLNSDDIEDRGENSFNKQNYKIKSENCVQSNESESTSPQKEIGENESKGKNATNEKKCEGNFNKFRNKTDNNVSDTEVRNNKKKMYMEKLIKKRAENGILLLPSKVERKLYNIKKALRRKNVPPELIKDIIRKERRKEELDFRKTLNTFKPFKTCFNCRKKGHVLADCPVKLGSSNQETGICFKCGSVEHTSFKCTSGIQGFPFAKCFICKEQGHISRDCPSNTHGVYPKGGRCSLCGNVNHLKKDCPNLKKENEESDITLPTINEVSSIEEEISEKHETHTRHSKMKKTKIVKF